MSLLLWHIGPWLFAASALVAITALGTAAVWLLERLIPERAVLAGDVAAGEYESIKRGMA